MLANTIASFATVVALATAQVAPGFPVSASQSLTLVFAGNNTVSPPGELIPRGETAQAPVIRSPVGASVSSGSFNVLLAVDLDVPRNGTRVQLIHWIATDVTLSSTGNSSAGTLLSIPSTNPVPYLQPSPPVGDSPHSYTFILFQQPPNFNIPSQYANLSNNRVPFNTSQFLRDAGLTTALAANYIRVQNLTGTPTTTFPPARSPTGANSTRPAVFPGAASKSVDGGIMGVVGVVMAVVAGVAAFAL